MSRSNQTLDLPRVEITKAYHGLCGMQVCAVADATDEEILAVCNEENPSGTEFGWNTVIRDTSRDDEHAKEEGGTYGPVPCNDHDGRFHYIILC